MASGDKLVLALDQGTTSSRAILFDEAGKIVSIAQEEFEQIFPKAGWVEHDPMEILSSQIDTAEGALDSASVTRGDISCVGITNQRETCVVWDRRTGEPVMNAIVWQDRRTADHCLRIRNDHESLIRRKTGLEVDPYFSASKIAWILENVEGVRKKAENGELAFGTIDSWLIWNLTGGEKHVTDVSNASRTMLYDINSLVWDDELLSIFNVPLELMPDVVPSSGLIGEVTAFGKLNGLRIAGVAGDQQAALFGQRCFAEGQAKSTYGTGCFLLLNTGKSSAESNHRLLSTVGWQIGDKCEYALEGSVFIGGAVVQWLRDSLGIIGSASEIEELAREAGGSDGVHFVPAFAGLGSPYWDPNARGLITGLTRGTGRGNISYAALEAIAFQTTELLEAMQQDSDASIPELRVDGGAALNDLLMQIQADFLQIPIVRSDVTETTALGAAYLAGLACGVWESTDQIEKTARADQRFEPSINPDEACEKLEGWKRAVEKSLDWAENETIQARRTRTQ
ncbi:MAG: glycerol kinase [Acidobacteria bacterium]|nr:MAG: glycerol kinase [Acidobacteriota bacterium]REK02862.1 MAG: glycerol kinase [Acidobacteriota bacterium]REK13334.1 MAG: glycerol kinase [Acidobacteriota bacterium]REK41328.1 MAG: glycerol kinase [Acidobacteriota bacterium]